MKKKLTVALVLLLAAALLYFGGTALYTWQAAPKTAMPADSLLTVQLTEGGTRLLTWTSAGAAEEYTVELFAAAGDEAPLKTVITSAAELALAPGEDCGAVRITPQTGWKIGWMEQTKQGTPFETACYTSIAEPGGAQWSADTGKHTLNAVWKNGNADGFLLTAVYADGSSKTVEVQSPLQLDFSEACPIPAPEYGTPCTLTIAAYRVNGSSRTCGLPSAGFTFTTDDLYGTELNPSAVPEGDNRFTLNWERTKGNRFTAILTGAEGIVAQAEYEAGEVLTLTTAQLMPFREYTLNVVATGAGEPIAAELSFTTGASVLGCTIWPIKDTELYTEAAAESALLGTIKEATALRVLEERDSFFRVETDLGEGWVDARYCMVNLPEYIGELCEYNITNSYKSVFKIHTYVFDRITDKVLEGYENVRLEDGSFLVPLLYPTAQKLIPAAQAAAEQGLKIVIYDAYRPRVATYQLYNSAKRIENCAIPSKNYYGSWVSVPPASEDYTYTRFHDLWFADDRWTLNSFLGNGGSYHNIGIAMDMTLMDTETGLELQMQTEMHDLSIYSITGRNNKNAKLLASIMKPAGFEGISSEWWHFQDSASRKELGITWWMSPGVSPLGDTLPHAEPISAEEAA